MQTTAVGDFTRGNQGLLYSDLLVVVSYHNLCFWRSLWIDAGNVLAQSLEELGSWPCVSQELVIQHLLVFSPLRRLFLTRLLTNPSFLVLLSLGPQCIQAPTTLKRYSEVFESIHST